MKTIKHLFQNPLQRHPADFTTTRQNSLALKNISEMLRSTLIGNDKEKHFIFDGLEAGVNGNFLSLSQGSIAVNVGEIWQARKIQEDAGEEGTIYGTWEVQPANYPGTIEFSFTAGSPDTLEITDNDTSDILNTEYTIEKGTWKDGIYVCSITSGDSDFFPTSGEFQIYVEFDGNDLIIYTYSKYRPEYTDYILATFEQNDEAIQWSGNTDVYNILQARLYYDYSYEIDVDIIDPVIPAVINQFPRKNNRELKIEVEIKSSSGAIQKLDSGHFKLAEFGADPNADLKPISDLENWVEENDTIEFINTYQNHRTQTVLDHPDGSVTDAKLFSSVREKINTGSVIDTVWAKGIRSNIKNELDLIVNNGTSQFEIQTGDYKSKINTRGVISDSIFYLDYLDPEFIQVGTVSDPPSFPSDLSDWETGAFSGDGTTYQLICDGSPSKIVNGSVEARANFSPYNVIPVTYNQGSGSNSYDVNTATGLMTKYGTVPDAPKIKYQYYQVRYDTIQAGFDPLTLTPIIEIKKGTIANGGLRNDNVNPSFPDADTDYIQIWGIKTEENQISFTKSTDLEDLRNYITLKIEKTKGPIIYGSLKDFDELSNTEEKTFLEFYGSWLSEGVGGDGPVSLVKFHQDENIGVLELSKWSGTSQNKTTLAGEGSLRLHHPQNGRIVMYAEENLIQGRSSLGQPYQLFYELSNTKANFNIPILANEGIKTENPSNNDVLQLHGGHTLNDTDGGYIKIYGESHATQPGDVIIGGANGTNKGNIYFKTSDTERLRITSTGDIVMTSNAGANLLTIFSSLNFRLGGALKGKIEPQSSGIKISGPVSIVLDTAVDGDISSSGSIDSTFGYDTSSGSYKVDGTQVVKGRDIGWSPTLHSGASKTSDLTIDEITDPDIAIVNLQKCLSALLIALGSTGHGLIDV